MTEPLAIIQSLLFSKKLQNVHVPKSLFSKWCMVQHNATKSLTQYTVPIASPFIKKLTFCFQKVAERHVPNSLTQYPNGNVSIVVSISGRTTLFSY